MENNSKRQKALETVVTECSAGKEMKEKMKRQMLVINLTTEYKWRHLANVVGTA